VREPKLDLIAKLLVQQRSRRSFLRAAMGVLVGIGARSSVKLPLGAAQSGCSLMQELCPAVFGGYECVNRSDDDLNCGGCGNECIGGSVCQYGECLCRYDEEACSDGYGRAKCTKIQNDPNNCGGCGVACPSGSSCQFGTCTCRSDTGDCPDSTKCQDGDCDCKPWQTLCPVDLRLYDFDFWCVNTDDDSSNCGDCGVTCPPGSHCLGGRCTCRIGKTLCPAGRDDQQCVDTLTDINNCGVCGNRCPIDGSCKDGVCTARPSDQVADPDSTPFGVGEVTDSELTAEKFGEYVPAKFPGHELISDLDTQSREAAIYPGLKDSTMFLYMDPTEPNAPYAIALGNVSVLPATKNNPALLGDLLAECSPSSGCEVLQQNVDRPGRAAFAFLSYQLEKESELYYWLVWGEVGRSLVYTLAAFSQPNFENLVYGFVNNALAARDDSLD
jgi:hypothetical protein